MAEPASMTTSATDRVVADLASSAVEALYRLLSDPLLAMSEWQLRVVESTLAPLRTADRRDPATRRELQDYVLRLNGRIHELLASDEAVCVSASTPLGDAREAAPDS